MSMLKRMSKKRNSGQIKHTSPDGSDEWAISNGAGSSETTTTTTTSARTSSHRPLAGEAAGGYADAQTPPASPAPLTSSSDRPMSREEKIAMLLAKAAPRTDDALPSSSSPLNRSLTLPRGSSYNVPKSTSLSLATVTASPHASPPASPRASPRASSDPQASPRGKKLERSTSYTAKSPRLSTTLTLITSAVASLSSPRGEKLRSRSGSFSGAAVDAAPRGTQTRIIYFPSPMAVMAPAQVYLVPNNVITEGMRAALAQAHDCEWGIGVGDTGENETELKLGGIQLLDKTHSARYRTSTQHKSRPTGQPGMLAEYLQTTAPEINIGKTTITHEYIFKNSV